jgi:hypothetical protein
VPRGGSKATTARFPSIVAVAFSGAPGGRVKTTGLIMSFSSWPRRWQCQTYSHPKFISRFRTMAGTPV